MLGLDGLAGHGGVETDSVDVLRVFVVFVEAEFVQDEEQDQHTCRDAHSQADDVDQRIGFVPPDIARGYFEVVLNHREASAWVLKFMDLDEALA